MTARRPGKEAHAIPELANHPLRGRLQARVFRVIHVPVRAYQRHEG